MKNCLYCFGAFKNGLSDQEIKEFFKLEYGKNWHNKYKSFCKFISGQTITGTHDITLYYRGDIENFMRPKGERFFD